MSQYLVTLIAVDLGPEGMRFDQVEADTPQEAANSVAAERNDPDGTRYSVQELADPEELEAGGE